MAKADKIVTYVLMVSRYFPATHPRKGLPTFFLSKITNKEKIHTIRDNYELWKKRIDQVNEGKAVLELRFWEGRPYHTKQTTLKTLKQGEVGIQAIDIDPYGLSYRIDSKVWIFDQRKIIAQNDGLTPEEFKDWFKKSDLSKPMAIIHFTKFRY